MKILIIKLRGIGDVLLSTPAIKSVKNKYPDSFISVLTEKPGTEVLKENPYIDEIITLDKNLNLYEKIKFLKSIKDKKFDIAIDLFGNPRSAILTLISGAKKRIGHNIRVRRFCYNIKVKGSEKIEYAVCPNIDIIKTLGIDTVNIDLVLKLNQYEKDFASKFFSQYTNEKKDLFIGVNPASSWATKVWKKENYISLIQSIVQKYNAKIFILWGPGEEKLAKDILNSTKGISIIIPPTNIRQLMGIIQKLDLLITNDSSPKHIAVALDVPTVTIYGATDPKAWNPPDDSRHHIVWKGLSCQPCNKVKCNTLECLEEITVTDVLEAVDKAFKKG
ncbi:MAG: glycosyltransferase family 9 protein [Candidatus Firestonebacteria bacterium]